MFDEFTRRTGGPAVLASLLTVQDLSPENIGAIIEMLFRPGDVVGQFVLLQTVAQSVNQPNVVAAVHTVKSEAALSGCQPRVPHRHAVRALGEYPRTS